MPSPPFEPAPEVEDALARGDVRALQALAAAADKRIGKAAKRALHRLRARGVAIPEVEAAPEAGAVVVAQSGASPLAEPREPFLATTVDGNGERAVFMPLKAPRGFVLHLAILSDELGILEMTARQLSRRQLRAFMTELAPETREVLREIPAARAAGLVEAAIELNPGSADVPAGRELLRALLEVSAGDTLDRDSAVPNDLASDDLALRESAVLLESPALQSYLPPRDAIESAGQKLEEVMVSPLLVDEFQRLAQMRHALERAADDFFTLPRRALYGARLLDAAELFSSRGDGANSARARAAAAALSSGRPIPEIPFARGMFERIFDLESAAKASPPTPPTIQPTPGGLILPK